MTGVPHVTGREKPPEKRRDANTGVQDALYPDGAPNSGYALVCANPKCPHHDRKGVFVSTRKGQKFCSASCRKAAWFDAHFTRIAT